MKHNDANGKNVISLAERKAALEVINKWDRKNREALKETKGVDHKDTGNGKKDGRQPEGDS